MSAQINDAAKFYQQYDKTLNVSTHVPFDCTITNLLDGGSRVQVVVKDPTQAPQTPYSSWTVNNVPYVETGHTPPETGPFVVPTGWSETPPATLSSIAFNMSGGTTVASDGTTELPFTIIATMSDSSTQDVTAAVIAASGITFNPSTGLALHTTPSVGFVGTVAGTYTVTATYQGKTANQSVTVS